MQIPEPPTRAWQKMTADFISKDPLTGIIYTVALIVVDRLTKYMIPWPVTRTSLLKDWQSWCCKKSLSGLDCQMSSHQIKTSYSRRNSEWQSWKLSELINSYLQQITRKLMDNLREWFRQWSNIYGTILISIKTTGLRFCRWLSLLSTIQEMRLPTRRRILRIREGTQGWLGTELKETMAPRRLWLWLQNSSSYTRRLRKTLRGLKTEWSNTTTEDARTRQIFKWGRESTSCGEQWDEKFQFEKQATKW